MDGNNKDKIKYIRNCKENVPQKYLYLTPVHVSFYKNIANCLTLECLKSSIWNDLLVY